MIIQNIPQTGIKLGRGHEYEIRIIHISLSRSHAQIKNVENPLFTISIQYYLFVCSLMLIKNIS